MSEPTREEQIKYLDGGISRLINQAEKLIDAPMYAEVIEKIKQLKGEARILQAIREALTEKPVTVSMKWIENLEKELWETAESPISIIYRRLTELGIEVSDNSAVGRRTSDQEGE